MYGAPMRQMEAWSCHATHTMIFRPVFTTFAPRASMSVARVHLRVVPVVAVSATLTTQILAAYFMAIRAANSIGLLTIHSSGTRRQAQEDQCPTSLRQLGTSVV